MTRTRRSPAPPGDCDEPMTESASETRDTLLAHAGRSDWNAWMKDLHDDDQ